MDRQGGTLGDGQSWATFFPQYRLFFHDHASGKVEVIVSVWASDEGTRCAWPPPGTALGAQRVPGLLRKRLGSNVVLTRNAAKERVYRIG